MYLILCNIRSSASCILRISRTHRSDCCYCRLWSEPQSDIFLLRWLIRAKSRPQTLFNPTRPNFISAQRFHSPEHKTYSLIYLYYTRFFVIVTTAVVIVECTLHMSNRMSHYDHRVRVCWRMCNNESSFWALSLHFFFSLLRSFLCFFFFCRHTTNVHWGSPSCNLLLISASFASPSSNGLSCSRYVRIITIILPTQKTKTTCVLLCTSRWYWWEWWDIEAFCSHVVLLSFLDKSTKQKTAGRRFHF